MTFDSINNPRAVIAGAGIAGLLTGLALARQGWAVRIVESRANPGEYGAGLQLSPNATRILAGMGLLDPLLPHALAPQSLRVRRAHDGAALMQMTLGDAARQRWGAPHLVIHRADLWHVLRDAVAAHPLIALETGTQVLGYTQKDDALTIHTRQGEEQATCEADVLVGADGLHSRVRAAMPEQDARAGASARAGVERPVWSGRTAFRALVEAERAPAFAQATHTNLWFGAKAHLVHYPVRDGRLINVVAIVEDRWRGEAQGQGQAQGDLWSMPEDPAFVQRRFAAWHPEARALLAAAGEWRRWPLFGRPAFRPWRDGRVILVGDAAHPLLPFLAQGACMAIEDAAELARALGNGQRRSVPTALAAFESLRQPRVRALQLASRRQGVISHFSGVAALARDVILRHMGEERMMRRMDWIYRYCLPPADFPDMP